MRIRRAATLLASAALFGVVTVAPATPALASPGSPVTPPSDCTATLINHYTSSLTCTNRPANQQWQAYRDCFGVWLDSGAYGNIVTGNGTSTAVCPERAQADSFVYFAAVV